MKTNRHAAWLVLGLALTLTGACKKKDESEQPDLGKATARIANDTQVLADAQAAANKVIRAQTDCDAVRAALPEARRTLEDVTPHVKTPGGRATLDGLKAQVNAVANTCG